MTAVTTRRHCAVGSYEVTVEKNGFRRESKTDISLVLGQRIEVSVTLTVGKSPDRQH